MRITAVVLHRLRHGLDPPLDAAWDPRPRRHVDVTVVEVRTDEDLTGWGSGDAMTGFEAYEHLFVGQDPLAIARHVRVLETLAFHSARYWPLEAALWDLAGKAAGLPVATLLGGAADRLPAYASTCRPLEPAARVEAALAARENGFRAMKLRIGADLEAGVAVVRAVREALGPRFTLMVDLNRMWRMPGDVAVAFDVPAVRRLAAELADLGVLWLEEPLPACDATGMRQVREATGMRLAGGEMVRTPAELLALLDADALDVYQPDVVLAVGISRARLVGELALLRNRWFTPHTWTDGLGLLANLHLVAGIGGGPFVEVPYDPPGWTPQRRDFFLAEPVTLGADGDLVVPAAPGLGATVDPDALRRWART